MWVEIHCALTVESKTQKSWKTHGVIQLIKDLQSLFIQHLNYLNFQLKSQRCSTHFHPHSCFFSWSCSNTCVACTVDPSNLSHKIYKISHRSIISSSKDIIQFKYVWTEKIPAESGQKIVYVFDLSSVMDQPGSKLHQCTRWSSRHAFPQVRYFIFVTHHSSDVQMSPMRSCDKLSQECSGCARPARTRTISTDRNNQFLLNEALNRLLG